jgi:uncharacterized membrane protein YphA (DoxX/SURF4 family)
MHQSLKLPHIFIRIALAFVFLWFGIDKFIHPQYWIDAWVPKMVMNVLGFIGLPIIHFMYINGAFEVLVGISLLSNMYIKLFSILSVIFLISIIIFNGFNEIVVRDVGLMGGFLALAFWPERRR